jgi:hypothetical protein
MVRPDREPLVAWVEADETYVGGPRPNRPGRGAAGKARVAGAVESGRGKTRGRRLVRLRLAVVPDVSARSLEGFLATAGYRHEPVNLTASWGDAALRLPAIHSVSGLAAIVEAAAAASASEYRADYAFHNVVSLQPLVEQHGVELRLFPDDVVEALGRTSREVIAELGARTPLTRRIHDSYMGFLERANVYGQWFELPMLRMRAAALGRV